ncbi:MAG: Cna B-type domain-containing protein [Clostridia bacterium]|nr:Cna B-type domain-containing protein [Clostridia bacterium]
MTKRILACVLAVFCLLMPLSVQAEELNTEQLCNLTLEYSHEGVAFADVEVAIYRVAEAHTDGSYDLIAPYDAYSVNIHGITSQKEWQDVAATLTAYITANGVEPTASGVTDKAGEVVLSDLPVGLYLVQGARAENEKGTYVFREFMIYLPTPAEDGTYQYDLRAKPKCHQYTPTENYRVVKLWKDTGSALRPDEVVVDIYKNGALHETVSLNGNNGWSYEWTDKEQARWQVTERDVPEGYQVSVTNHETVFTITNANPDAPPPPPATGDSFPWLMWVVIVCLVGFALVLVALWGRRYEKTK